MRVHIISVHADRGALGEDLIDGVIEDAEEPLSSLSLNAAARIHGHDQVDLWKRLLSSIPYEVGCNTGEDHTKRRQYGPYFGWLDLGAGGLAPGAAFGASIITHENT